nr:type II and III secretion system protein [Burkholderiales bacterium]
LINDEDRRTSNRVPGLGDLPMLDRLFGSRLDQKSKTEIVLLITPRIVRNVMRPEGLVAELPVGTDTYPGLPPLRIARTKAGDVALAAGGAGGPTAVFDDVPAASNPFGIDWRAPAQAQAGRELVVTLQFPPGRWKSGALAIVYDPAQLAPVGAAPAVPGQLRVAFEGGAPPRTLRWRTLGDKPGASQLRLEDADLVDDTGDSIAVTLPAPLAIEITKP